VLLAHSARDQLSVLRAEIKNQHSLGIDRRVLGVSGKGGHPVFVRVAAEIAIIAQPLRAN
jgi:hypothetical protein